MKILDEYGNEIENGDLIKLHFSVKNESESFRMHNIYEITFNKFYGVVLKVIKKIGCESLHYDCLGSDFFELLRNTDNVLKIEGGCFDMYNTITGLSKVKKVKKESKTEQ